MLTGAGAFGGRRGPSARALHEALVQVAAQHAVPTGEQHAVGATERGDSGRLTAAASVPGGPGRPVTLRPGPAGGLRGGLRWF